MSKESFPNLMSQSFSPYVFFQEFYSFRNYILVIVFFISTISTLWFFMSSIFLLVISNFMFISGEFNVHLSIFTIAAVKSLSDNSNI